MNVIARAIEIIPKGISTASELNLQPCPTAHSGDRINSTSIKTIVFIIDIILFIFLWN